MINPDRPKYANDFVRALRRLDPQFAAVVFRTAFGGDLRDILHRVNVPTLVLQTHQDPAVPLEAARWMAANFPSARLVELPTTGHFPHMVDPDRVTSVVRPFVEERP